MPGTISVWFARIYFSRSRSSTTRRRILSRSAKRSAGSYGSFTWCGPWSYPASLSSQTKNPGSSAYNLLVRLLFWGNIFAQKTAKESIDMKDSMTDQAKGAFHEAKGKIKEKAGQLTNDPKLESEGKGEKVAGKVQKKVGQVEKVFEK